MSGVRTSYANAHYQASLLLYKLTKFLVQMCSARSSNIFHKKSEMIYAIVAKSAIEKKWIKEIHLQEEYQNRLYSDHSLCAFPSTLCSPMLQSTCHYIVNHDVKIWHVRRGGGGGGGERVANYMQSLNGGTKGNLRHLVGHFLSHLRNLVQFSSVQWFKMRFQFF